MILTTFYCDGKFANPFDEFDQRIVQSLLADGRRGGKDLAAMVGLSEATVSRRCGLFESTGAFRLCGFVDPWQCGCEAVVIARFGVRGSVHAAAEKIAAVEGVHRLSWTAQSNGLDALLTLARASDLHALLDTMCASCGAIEHRSSHTVLAMLQGHDSDVKPAPTPMALALRDSTRQRYTDLRLVKLLQGDFRMTFTSIADRLSTSITLAGEHTKRIVNSGAIRTIGVYDHGSLGRPLTINVHISFAKNPLQHAASLRSKLRCNLVFVTADPEQVVAEVSVENEAAAVAWVEKARHLGDVRSVRWDPLLTIYKQTYDWAVPGETPKTGEP